MCNESLCRHCMAWRVCVADTDVPFRVPPRMIRARNFTRHSEGVLRDALNFSGIAVFVVEVKNFVPQHLALCAAFSCCCYHLVLAFDVYAYHHVTSSSDFCPRHHGVVMYTPPQPRSYGRYCSVMPTVHFAENAYRATGSASKRFCRIRLARRVFGLSVFSSTCCSCTSLS